MKAFREAIGVTREIIRRNDLKNSTSARFVERLASMKDAKKCNLLHEAAKYAMARISW